MGPKESKQVNSEKTNFGKGIPQNRKGELVRSDQMGPRSQDRQRKQCFSCGEWGHMSSASPKRKKDLPKAAGVSYMVDSSACIESNR
ncbi:hypothetical protein ACJMK2_010337, partial [Sinanodonta woodiana]